MIGEHINNQSSEGNDHPSAQHVAAWLSGTSSAEERLGVEHHFIHCAECREQMALIRQAIRPDNELHQSQEFVDLLQLSEQAAQQVWQQRKASAEAAPQMSAQTTVGPQRKTGFRQWLTTSEPLWSWWKVASLAAGLLLLVGVLSSVLAWRLWREQQARHQTQELAAQLSSQNKKLAERLSQLEQTDGEQLKQEHERRLAAEAQLDQLRAQFNQSQQNIPIYSLRLSTGRGPDDELQLHLKATDTAAWIALLRSAPYEFPEYTVELIDPHGQKVQEIAGLRPVGDEGTLNLMLKRASFKPGKYQVRLFGQRGKAQKLLGEYVLTVTIAR